MKLYYNRVLQNQYNSEYPLYREIKSHADLEEVVQYDHVCAEYKDGHRKNSNFIQADCSMFDVDNSETDNPDEWVAPKNVKAAFPNVPFFVCYSRNHMKPKNGKAPRPKFHVYFSDRVFRDGKEYAKHKQQVCTYFKAFDPNAKDSARFFFGVEKPKVEYFAGEMSLDAFMKNINTHSESEKYEINEKATGVIPEGRRNSTLSRFAVRMLKRYGNTADEAYRRFIAESQKCTPLLQEKELCNIWESAVSYYKKEIVTAPDYIAPEYYENIKKCISLKPKDLTDVGEATVLAREYGAELRYSAETSFLSFNGKSMGGE